MRLTKSGMIRGCGALLIGLSATSAARATLQVSFKPIPISAGAMADDPQLKETATYHPLARTFEMDMTQGAGEKWTFATINTTLNGGSFYIPTSNNSHIGQEGIWNNVGFRNLQNDTFVTTMHGSAQTSILGKSDYPVNQIGPAIMPGAVPGFTPTVDSSPTTIDITWGDAQAIVNPVSDGTYMIARITTLGMASGDILGHFSGTQHGFTDVKYVASIPLPKPFDFNDDGVADAGDINDAIEVEQGDISGYLAQHPELNGDTNYINDVGDLNGDGVVNKADIADYLYVMNNAGVSSAEQAPLAALAPEPGSFLLISLAGVGLLRRRAARQ